jgi:hypothetical protein
MSIVIATDAMARRINRLEGRVTADIRPNGLGQIGAFSDCLHLRGVGHRVGRRYELFSSTLSTRNSDRPTFSSECGSSGDVHETDPS